MRCVIPIYDFECKKCGHQFEQMCEWEAIKSQKCHQCKSKRLQKLISKSVTITFTNPKGTSKEDNFDYVAQHNHAQAQQESAAAREQHKGKNPYKNIDDMQKRMNYID